MRGFLLPMTGDDNQGSPAGVPVSAGFARIGTGDIRSLQSARSALSVHFACEGPIVL